MAGANPSYTVTCPSCKKEWPLYTAAQCAWYGCQSCDAYFPIDGRTRPVKAETPNKLQKPHLAIGTFGELGGIKWQVTGYCLKKEKQTKYKWEEYSLFNPYHGYRTLSVFDGHWIFIRPSTFVFPNTVKRIPIIHQGVQYHVFNQYRTRSLLAYGEFTDNVSTELGVTEYIAPPFLLSIEKSSSEVSFLEGEHVEPTDVEKAFTSVGPMPYQNGVGMVQVKKIRTPTIILRTWAWSLVALAVLLQIIFSASAKDQVVISDTFRADNFISKPAFITKPFVLASGSQNLLVSITAPVSNNWLYDDFRLVNETTKQEWYFGIGTEYYSGISDGESWSEGGQTAEKLISGLPAGTYRATITLIRDSTMISQQVELIDSTKRTSDSLGRTSVEPYYTTIGRYSYMPSNCDIKMTTGINVVSNFFIVLLLLAAYPTFVVIGRNSFEKKRWMNSDYDMPKSSGPIGKVTQYINNGNSLNDE
jgi:hypothetical protein